jgi:hypothetical protein
MPKPYHIWAAPARKGLAAGSFAADRQGLIKQNFL